MSTRPKFSPWDWVRKYTGEARYEGVILCSYLTTKGHLRYVVEVYPQGFQMIAHENTLEFYAAPSKADEGGNYAQERSGSEDS